MSFLKRLFGGGSGGASSAPQAPAAEVEHQGFTIRATPYQEGGQWQTCGVIVGTLNGAAKEHRFIRADRFASQDQAAEHTIFKGKQIIDQSGGRVFD